MLAHKLGSIDDDGSPRCGASVSFEALIVGLQLPRPP
jgi:hypothetical protein